MVKYDALRNAIMRQFPECNDVVVESPYVFVITEGGKHAVRFWMPETLDGDIGPGEFVLRPAPPNAEKL